MFGQIRVLQIFFVLALSLSFVLPAYGQSAPEEATAPELESDDPDLAPVNLPDVPPPPPETVPTDPSAMTAPPSESEGKTAPVLGGQTAEKAQGAKSAKGSYSRPLLFAPQDNGITFTSPQIKWNLTGGNRINLGGLTFDAASIRITLDQVRRDKVARRYRESRSSSVVTNVSFQWPSIMSRTGRISAETEKGKVIWANDINEEKRADWLSNLKDDDEKILRAHYKNSWGILDIDPNAAFLKNGTRFRFCLSRVVTADERIRICSNLHVTTRTGETIKVQSIDENKTPNVFIGKDRIGVRATVNFPEDRKIDVRVQFRSGATVALSSRPLQVQFLDVVLSSDKETIILTGRGPKPLGKVKDLQVPPNHFWSATGIETQTIWQLSIPRDPPTLRVLGAWNVPFTYLINYEALPSEQDRVYINTRTGSGTYVDGARIRVLSPQGAKLRTSEIRVQNLPGGGKNEYRWNFAADDQGKNNKSQITIVGRGENAKDWVAHYQLYRGFPYEVSGRLTGIVSADLETVVMGEVAAGAWFERIFGMDSYYLSERRWGMNARYFRALQSFKFSPDAEALSAFAVSNIDLRYNLIPGIWNRDELFGLTLGSQMIDLGGLNANLGGIGAYWARTMPRIFDDIFNILPFLRYPKYVAMEFTYYPMSFSNEVTPGATYNLNFHGKLFWSPRFYGEAGFGIKQFNYVYKPSQSDVLVGTAYGTIGLGVIF